MNDKYKMFKNFLHNELGISKEDIKEWVKEAVEQEAEKIGKEIDFKRIYERAIFYNVQSNATFKQIIMQEILKKFDFDILIKSKDEQEFKTFREINLEKAFEEIEKLIEEIYCCDVEGYKCPKRIYDDIFNIFSSIKKY